MNTDKTICLNSKVGGYNRASKIESTMLEDVAQQ